MTRQEHLLTCVAEEAGEVAKEACKALRFGLLGRPTETSNTNWYRLLEELQHLEAVVLMIASEADLEARLQYHSCSGETGLRIHQEKRDKVEEHLKVSTLRGTLI